MSANNPDILFGKFKIIDCLKKDERSGVYLAHHIYLEKDILLKTLDESRLADSAMLERFKREAQILAHFDHPNVIKVLDFGTADGFFYISFEYFVAKNLREKLQENMTREQIDQVLFSIAAVLQAIHQAGIIHRDLKPENILIDDNGLVKLADFGCAQTQDHLHVTEKSSIIGTPGYMSPEQIRGEALTPASDLFSFGIIAHECLGGTHPFLGDTVNETLNNILTAKRKTSLSGGQAPGPPWAEPVAGLLSVHPAQRHAGFEQILRMGKIPHQEPAPVSRRQSGRRIGGLSTLIVAAGSLAIALLVLFSRGVLDPTRQPSSQPAVELIPEDSLTVAGDQESLRIEIDHNAETAAEPAAPPVQNVRHGSVNIETTPWVEIWIDGDRIDRTPLQQGLQLLPGSYEMTLANPQFPDHRLQFTLDPGQIVHYSLSLDTLFGYIHCEVFPWANLYLDDHLLGQTPISRALPVSPGRHTLRVENPVFEAVEKRFSIARKETLVFEVDLEKLFEQN